MKVFITGASSGIGKVLAHEYAKRHKNESTIIGLASRRSEHLQQLQQDLESSYKVKCVIYPLDVRDNIALSAAAADFIQQHGTPDVVIANAGVSSGTLTEHQEDIAAFQALNSTGRCNTLETA